MIALSDLNPIFFTLLLMLGVVVYGIVDHTVLSDRAGMREFISMRRAPAKLHTVPEREYSLVNPVLRIERPDKSVFAPTDTP